MRRRLAATLISAGLGIALAGCAHADAAPAATAITTPAAAPGFPDLRSVPRASVADTSQRHWDAVAADVLAAAQAMKNNPRSAPGAPEDPNAFLNQAQRDLEATRNSH